MRELTTFGLLVKQLCRRHKLTQTELSIKLKYSPSHVSNILVGVKRIPRKFVARLTDALELDQETVEQLDTVVQKQIRRVSISIRDRSEAARQLAFLFATRFETMTEEQIEQMLIALETLDAKSI